MEIYKQVLPEAKENSKTPPGRLGTNVVFFDFQSDKKGPKRYLKHAFLGECTKPKISWELQGAISP